jgi:cation transport ATPase
VQQDETLMSDDLRQLPFALGLSRAAMRIVGVNVGLSIGIKLVFAWWTRRFRLAFAIRSGNF